MKRYFSIILCALMILGLFTGCAASDTSPEVLYQNGDAAMDYVYAETSAAMEPESLKSSSSLDSVAQVNRKLVKTVYLDAETEHFDELSEGLTAKIAELGGYVETREVDNGRSRRYCSMTIRIPADKLDSFVEHVNASANVTSTSETAEDITLQYVDTEAKITALKTEQARLLELLEGAKNLSEILEVEARLSDVTYELERYASQMRTYDNLVDYATVHLSFREVEVLTPVEEPSVWERISTGFVQTLDDLGEDLTDLFVWFVVNLPYLLIWAVVITVIVLLVRRAGRKRRARRAPPPPPVNETQN